MLGFVSLHKFNIWHWIAKMSFWIPLVLYTMYVHLLIIYCDTWKSMIKNENVYFLIFLLQSAWIACIDNHQTINHFDIIVRLLGELQRLKVKYGKWVWRLGGGIVFCFDSKFDTKARKGFPCYISLNFNWID